MYICSRQLWYSHISLNLLYFFFDISYFLWYFGFHFLISLSFSGTISCHRLRQKSIEFKSLAISSFSSVFLFILAVTVLSHYSCVYLFYFYFFFLILQRVFNGPSFLDKCLFMPVLKTMLFLKTCLCDHVCALDINEEDLMLGLEITWGFTVNLVGVWSC